MKTKSIGPAMKHYRERLDWSRRKAATKADIAFSWWAQLEREDAGNPGTDKIFAIARVLGVTVEELYNWSPQPAAPETIAELAPVVQEIVALLQGESDQVLLLARQQVELVKAQRKQTGNHRPEQQVLFPASLARVLPGL